MAGRLIINADDWGYDANTTDRILTCFRAGAVSSVSAMMFMLDSERGAALAREHGIDAGLHLNFSECFSKSNCPPGLAHHQNRVAGYLTRHSLARVVYNPVLTQSFEYIVAAQCEEFSRLYGAAPKRLDGHHHLHLSSNVLVGGLLSVGTQVRRNFSFQRGEKSMLNRYYRKIVDRRLAKRHLLTDYLFTLPLVQAEGRLDRIAFLSRGAVVEVETHPVRMDEYRFLAGGTVFGSIRDVPIARGFSDSSTSQ